MSVSFQGGGGFLRGQERLAPREDVAADPDSGLTQGDDSPMSQQQRATAPVSTAAAAAAAVDAKRSLLERMPPAPKLQMADVSGARGSAASHAAEAVVMLRDRRDMPRRPPQQDSGEAPPPAPAPTPAAAPPSGSNPIPPPTREPAPTPAPAGTTAASTYRGEPAVSEAWLHEREAALNLVRGNYTAQRQGEGPGWVSMDLGTNDAGEQSTGRWFDERAFRHHYASLATTAASPGVMALARAYGVEASAVLGRHPELLDLALSDHLLNDGPAPAGQAMGDAKELGLIDLHLADPQIRELIATYGGAAVPEPRTDLARAQLNLYGRARYEQLTRLDRALGRVREQYQQGLQQAVRAGGDIDAFTARYIAGDGLANRAFRDHYGQSHTTSTTEYGGESSNVTSALSVFDNAAWVVEHAGLAPMRNIGAPHIDLNRPPGLHDARNVGFDLTSGWITPTQNIDHGTDWVETVAIVVILGGAAAVTGGLASQWAGLTFGGSVTTAAVAGAAAGATTSTISGLLNENLNLRDVLRGALSGALTAGLMQGFNIPALNANPALGLVSRATVQGGVQALLGGSFTDGAIAGLASGLADLMVADMNTAIGTALDNGTMSAGDALMARTVSRVIGSAVRALGNPDDPQHAFARDLLNETIRGVGAAGQREQAAQVAADNRTLLNDANRVADSGYYTTPDAAAAQPGEVSTPPASVAFDDQGQPMPGVVDSTAPAPAQAQQLAARLREQGLSADEAAERAMRAVNPSAAAAVTTPSAESSDIERVVVTGRRMPTDALDNQYDSDAAGNQIVHLAGGGMLTLNAADAVSIVDGVAHPGWAGLARLAQASAFLARVAAAASPLALLMGIPGNAGSSTRSVALNEDMRFDVNHGSLYGQVWDRNASGQWVARPERYAGFSTDAGFMVLSEEEIARNSGRTQSPVPQQPGPRGTPPLVVPPGQQQGTPGYEAQPPSNTSPPPRPAADPPSWRDLIVDRSRDSEILGRNLRADGLFPPGPRYEAHHIVPSRAGGSEMQELRDRLAGMGLTDLNQAVNGVWLPGFYADPNAPESYHGQLNNPDYFFAVREQFANVMNLDQAIAALHDIADQLRNGTYPGAGQTGGKTPPSPGRK
jgi:hypothetical protein